jgi:hypothetical protein
LDILAMKEKIKKNKIAILMTILILTGLGISIGINIESSWNLTGVDIISWWCELKMDTGSKWCQHREKVEFCEVLCIEEAGLEAFEYKECVDFCLK